MFFQSSVLLIERAGIVHFATCTIFVETVGPLLFREWFSLEAQKQFKQLPVHRIALKVLNRPFFSGHSKEIFVGPMHSPQSINIALADGVLRFAQRFSVTFPVHVFENSSTVIIRL